MKEADKEPLSKGVQWSLEVMAIIYVAVAVLFVVNPDWPILVTNKAFILIIIFNILIISPSIIAQTKEKVVPHDIERFVFESGHFKVVGELRIPKTEGKYPLRLKELVQRCRQFFSLGSATAVLSFAFQTTGA